MRSLNKLIWLQRLVVRIRLQYYTKFWGMDIHPNVRISTSAKLDKTYPIGIHIDEYTYIAFGAAILSHDMTRNLRTHTYIGKRCFIGARSLVLPGVRVGDGSIVAAGAVVTRDVPPDSIVAGNPAVVVRSGIDADLWGILRKPGEPYLRDALTK
jgi:acetyltransferase-like isoleucine patch superfamily enzyme